MKSRLFRWAVHPALTRLGAVAALACASPALALAPGADGVHVTVRISGTADVVRSAFVDTGGKLVMAGDTATGVSAIARVLPNGVPDATFDGDGVATFDLSASSDALHGIVRLDDGRYVACGTFASPGTANDFFVARFNADGSLDTSFDGVGYAVTPFLESGPGGSLFDECDAVAVQADGAIVSAGVTYETGPATFAITRHTSSGQLDATFGSGGKIDVNPSASPNGNAEAHAVAIQPDGRILVAGFAGGVQNNADFVVMRFATDGTPDATFGVGGIARVPVGAQEDIANAMVLQPDGRIVLAGSSTSTETRRDFALARLTSTGALDATFGTGGVVTTPVGPADDVAYALALMPWGRLVAAGSARIDASASGTEFAVVAYDADGTPDRYFGDAGVRVLPLSASGTDAIAHALATDFPGTRFWVAGTAAATADAEFVAVELGLPDTIFRHGFDRPTSP